MKKIQKSRMQSIKGDAQLTTLIDPFSFLEDLFEQQELSDEETPDQGQCQ
jgi:hypothetical protein